MLWTPVEYKDVPYHHLALVKSRLECGNGTQVAMMVDLRDGTIYARHYRKQYEPTDWWSKVQIYGIKDDWGNWAPKDEDL